MVASATSAVMILYTSFTATTSFMVFGLLEVRVRTTTPPSGLSSHRVPPSRRCRPRRHVCLVLAVCCFLFSKKRAVTSRVTVSRRLTTPMYVVLWGQFEVCTTSSSRPCAEQSVHAVSLGDRGFLVKRATLSEAVAYRPGVRSMARRTRPLPPSESSLPDAPAAVWALLHRRKTMRSRCLWLASPLPPSDRLLSTTL